MNFLNFLFPKRCLNCGKIGNYFCSHCLVGVSTITPNETICPICEKPALAGGTHPYCRNKYTIDGLTSFFHYSGPVRQAIKTLKYRYVSDLASEFVDLISASLLNNATMKQCDNLILIPVPLHPSRLRFRGFNQAEVLGRLIADKFGLSVRIDLLKRIKKTIPQVEMKDRKERLRNMDKVFFCRETMQQSGNVILFDDVFTTGATMRAAANVLKRVGAKWVWGMTMAR